MNCPPTEVDCLPSGRTLGLRVAADFFHWEEMDDPDSREVPERCQRDRAATCRQTSNRQSAGRA
ncbi:MAG TPA: hypothetical protein VIR57_11555 [Chloroflexota bacterium]|jgi:hypothetical protein